MIRLEVYLLRCNTIHTIRASQKSPHAYQTVFSATATVSFKQTHRGITHALYNRPVATHYLISCSVFVSMTNPFNGPFNGNTADYERKKRKLVAQMSHARAGKIGLEKDTSNLFRERDNKTQTAGHRLNVKDFNKVLAVNPQENWLETEGMATYETLVDTCIKHDVMPAVVPQLKSITLGGAVAGIGIESSSFRYGLPHETVQEMEVLLSSGDVINCTPDNEHSDLFYGLPNSYGTLGYILKLKALTVPVKPFVKITNKPYHKAESFFQAMQEGCMYGEADFVDGVVFDKNELFLTTAQFVDAAPALSDYTWMKIYYQSIKERFEDYLTTKDYIWRWDTDWFWCSKNLFVQNPPMRMLLGRRFLNSATYHKVMRWNTRVGLTKTLGRLAGNHSETVIQDVDIPIQHAPEFLHFLHQEIGIKPIWICPIGHYDQHSHYDLYPLKKDVLYVNFGFWAAVSSRQKREHGFLNKKIERITEKLDGVKSLYADSYYDRESFWSIYNKSRYDELKNKYDPDNKLKDLYDKCVLRK